MATGPLPADVRDKLDVLQQKFDEAADRLVAEQDEDLATFTNPERYLKEVLPAELAKLQHEQSPIPKPFLLVLLCGTTPQPLLLSEHFCNPSHVLLVGTDTPDGRDAMEQVQRLLPPDRSLKPWEVIHATDPAQAYKTLHRRLTAEMKRWRIDKEQVLIDITGGKKTMIAAAFLVASELGLRTIYVDGEHHPKLRLPRPGKAKVSLLDDPVATFWLRQRDRARELFEQGNYQASADLWTEIAAKAQALAEDESLALNRARAKAVALWEEGAYIDAKRTLVDAGLTVPPPLEVLATHWRSDEERRLRRFATESHPGMALGEPLLRFCADRIGWALKDRKRAHLRRAFLSAFAACDAALDGLALKSCADLGGAKKNNYVQPPKEVRNQVIEKIGESSSFAHSSNNASNPLREHRNALAHRIAAPSPKYVEELLDGDPCLADKLLRKVGGEFCMDESRIELILSGRFTGLDSLNPA